MRNAQAARIQASLKDRINATFSNTIHFGLSCNEHCTKLGNSVWSTSEFNSLPQYRRAYLRGVADQLFGSLYHATGYAANQSPLTSIIIGPDGRKFADDSWLSESGEYKMKMETRHVWRAYWEKGEYREW